MDENPSTVVAPARQRLSWGRRVPTAEAKRKAIVLVRWPYRVLLPPMLLMTALLAASSAQELNLRLDPAKTTAEIRLSGNMHTVEGSFAFKRGSLRFSPATGAVSGEIVFDATSGKTGNDSRDHKMHKDVLESQRYPEIIFRPDRAEGTFLLFGTCVLQVHGMFAIHGAEHEVTVPVEVSTNNSMWTATASFEIPYAEWGMKNPSRLFLRVSNAVGVRFRGGGVIHK